MAQPDAQARAVHKAWSDHDDKRPWIVTASTAVKQLWLDEYKGKYPLSCKANSDLASSDKLRPHGVAAVQCALDSVLVLVRAAQEILHALASGSPDEVLVSRQVGHLVGMAGLDKLAADLIGHALELSKGDARLGTAGVADGASPADRLSIVCGKDHVGIGELPLALNNRTPLAGEDSSGNSIVAGIGLPLGVVEALAGIGAEVGATDELDTQGEAALLGFGKVARNDSRCSLPVCLVGTIDSGRVSRGVVLASKHLGPAVDSILESILLGIKEESNTALLGKGADVVDGLVEVGRGLVVSGQLVQSEAAGTSELESDVVTGLGQADGLESAIGPRLNLGGDVVSSLLALVLGSSGLCLILAQDNLLGVTENDASETNVLEAGDGGANLGRSLTSAELSVNGFLEEEAEKRVLVGVEDGVFGVSQDRHDAERRGQENGRGRDEAGEERADDRAQGQNGERGVLGLSDGRLGRGINRGQLGDGVGASMRGADVVALQRVHRAALKTEA